MNPHPLRLIVTCADRTGRRVTASVVIEHEAQQFRWHATLADSGHPAAELLGACAHLDKVEAAVCAKIARIQAVGAVTSERRPPLRP